MYPKTRFFWTAIAVWKNRVHKGWWIAGVYPNPFVAHLSMATVIDAIVCVGSFG